MPFKQGVINPWRAIGDFELFIFTGGEARMSVEDVDRPCPDGSFVLMRPATRHLSVCLSKSVFVRWMHFDWTPGRPATFTKHLDGPFSKIPEMSFERPSFYKSGVVCGRLHGEAALELHDSACAKMSIGSPQARRLARAIFLEELLSLLDVPEPGAGKGSKPDERLAFEAMDLLRKLALRPHREDASLQSGLSTLGRSYGHVERCFKRHFGSSPERYLAGLRVERAKELLLSSSLNVAEVAEALGFDDPCYFSRLFSRKAGVSPAKFRSESRRSL